MEGNGLRNRPVFDDDRKFIDILQAHSDSQDYLNLGPQIPPTPFVETQSAKLEGGESQGSQSSSSQIKYDQKTDKETAESTNFMSVFEYYDFSFLALISLVNFG